MATTKLSPSNRGGIDEIKKKWGLEEPNSQPQEWAEELVSDFLQSVPGNINDLLSPDQSSPDDLKDDGFPDTQIEWDSSNSEPILSKYPFERWTLVLSLSKLILLKNKWGEDLTFITLTYQGESKNKWSNWMKLLKFSDGNNMFYWDGEQFRGNHITLQKYIEENGYPRYTKCDFDALIHKVI